MKHVKRRLLSFLLALCLAVPVLTAPAYAQEAIPDGA